MAKFSIYAASPRNLFIKYCCPFPVTLVVLIILAEPSELFMILSFTSRSPCSMLFCVGIFQSAPFRLIKYKILFLPYLDSVIKKERHLPLFSLTYIFIFHFCAECIYCFHLFTSLYNLDIVFHFYT